MMQNKINAMFVVIFLAVGLVTVNAVTADECFNKGFANCLDDDGSCTSSTYSCSETCSVDSQCFFDCCYNGYCAFSSNCSFTDGNILVIILPVVFGVFFLIACIFFCIKRQQARSRVETIKNNQLIGAMQAQNMNNLMQMQMMANAASANQNMYSNQQMMMQQQNNMMFGQPQQTPYIQHVQLPNQASGNVTYM